MAYQPDFQALLISGASVSEPIHRMWSDLCYALRNRGIQALNFGMTNRDFDAGDFTDILRDLAFWQGPKLLISPGAGTIIPTDTGGGNIKSFAEAYDIPVWSFSLDFPARFHWRLDNAYERSIITCVDADGLPLIQEMNYPCRASGLFAHAGPPPHPAIQKASDRPLDIIFIGQVWKPKTIADWNKDLELSQQESELFQSAIDISSGKKQGVFSSFSKAREKLSLTLDRDRSIDILCALERYIHQTTRYQILKSITKHQVQIYGAADPEIIQEMPQHKFHGAVSFAKGLEIMANAKIVLNPVAVFRDGGHERIFYALSRGAVVASTYSHFLAEEFDNQLGLIPVEEDQDNDQALSEVLTGGKLDKIQAAGVQNYRNRHLWDHRIDALEPLLQKLFQ